MNTTNLPEGTESRDLNESMEATVEALMTMIDHLHRLHANGGKLTPGHEKSLKDLEAAIGMLDEEMRGLGLTLTLPGDPAPMPHSTVVADQMATFKADAAKVLE